MTDDICPQCGSDDPEVEEIACIRSPEPDKWHKDKETNIKLPIDFPG